MCTLLLPAEDDKENAALYVRFMKKAVEKVGAAAVVQWCSECAAHSVLLTVCWVCPCRRRLRFLRRLRRCSSLRIARLGACSPNCWSRLVMAMGSGLRQPAFLLKHSVEWQFTPQGEEYIAKELARLEKMAAKPMSGGCSRAVKMLLCRPGRVGAAGGCCRRAARPVRDHRSLGQRCATEPSPPAVAWRQLELR